MPKQQCQAENTSQQEDLEGLARDVLRKRHYNHGGACKNKAVPRVKCKMVPK